MSAVEEDQRPDGGKRGQEASKHHADSPVVVIGLAACKNREKRFGILIDPDNHGAGWAGLIPTRL
ncbi:hypothetical protein [Mesorhizobium sp.]|uniref:hypothetical protein n=1 Tax=Mesorhizobium sp. TaxID=1871066 RepID=UPI0025B90F1D|nr:hypothetical protein [Mesorhizobium sp.]